jgi:phage terminase large subunit-like protein
MSPALRDLESVILEKKLRHGGHPTMNMCCHNAVVERDAAGNRKLSKKRATGRIDGMIALLMAFGVAPLRTAVRFDPAALIG